MRPPKTPSAQRGYFSLARAHKQPGRNPTAFCARREPETVFSRSIYLPVAQNRRSIVTLQTRLSAEFPSTRFLSLTKKARSAEKFIFLMKLGHKLPKDEPPRANRLLFSSPESAKYKSKISVEVKKKIQGWRCVWHLAGSESACLIKY